MVGCGMCMGEMRGGLLRERLTLGGGEALGRPDRDSFNKITAKDGTLLMQVCFVSSW